MWGTSRKRHPSIGVACLFLSVLGTSLGQLGQLDSGPSNLAFFNASLSSQVTIDTTLNLTQQTVFSFRTCSEGTLLAQTGGLSADGGANSFILSLNSEGSLVLFLRNKNWDTDNVLVGTGLTNNQWYTVDINSLLGRIHLRVEQGGRELYEEMISNSTFRRYLLDFNMQGGEGLVVGEGFTGCIEHGAGLQFTASNTADNNVRWGECPLDSPSVRGCDLQQVDPCYSFPCLNGGTCRPNGTAYHCKCPVSFSGKRCEEDLGDQACVHEPCENGGTCSILNSTSSRRVLCNCPKGFAGIRCENNIDECGSFPCRNGGQCKDELNGFTCNCTGTGYDGVMCERNIDECLNLRPCLNNGTCINTPGSYKCSCPPGYAGMHCDEPLDECDSHPCQNGGECTDHLARYTCTCKSGFTGYNCEINKDDCVGSTCVPPRICIDGVDDYTCQCAPGYQELEDGCQDVNECVSQPCVNGATCVNEINYYRCQCPPGYQGDNCEMDINECADDPCENGARCKDEVGRYFCDCLPGFSGVNCSSDINECVSSPCQNDGRCIDQVAGYRCICPAGLVGVHCEEDIKECASSPCLNGATCIDATNSYNCLCLDGFDGVHCQVDIDECASSPCQNEATCNDGVNNYTCECLPQWMGQNCSEPYNECAFGPCLNEAKCTATPGTPDYFCTCKPGFTGINCETNIDDCMENACHDYQVCADLIEDYRCQCPIGYTGDRCEVDINECASNPCINGGTCLDLEGNYSCSCAGQWIDLSNYTGLANHKHWSGYVGRNCEVETDECEYDPPICLNGAICQKTNTSRRFKCFCTSASVDGVTNFYSDFYCQTPVRQCDLAAEKPPCFNGATCHNQEYNYTCTCAPGYSGPRCRININECASNPCQNNGTCEDLVNGYTCECPEGFSGPHCEINIDECMSNPCLNGGRCMDGINRFACDCGDTGFEGPRCEINIDDCLTKPCLNNGTCFDEIKGYTCQCYPAYQGQRCELDPDECLSSPCHNGATCLQRSNQSWSGFKYETAEGFDCQCVPGYTGEFCGINIDECGSNPCVHGACHDRINEYYCLCDPGYEGANCDQEINECTLYDPCKNGASCVDQIANYHCICAAESEAGISYGGRNCTTLLTGCTDHGCLNEAKCVPHLVDEPSNDHDYTCQCLPGFTGEFCQKVTTASFNGSSWMQHVALESLDDLLISFSFRTTLPNGTLFYVTDQTNTNSIYVVLTRNQTLTIYVKFSDNSVGADNLETFKQEPLNDAEWHQVVLEINGSSVMLKLVHPDCQKSLCQTSITLADPDIVLTHLYFGGLADTNLQESLRSSADPFIGCMRDIQVDSVYLTPEDYVGDVQKSSNVMLGCERQPPCRPQPCQNGGQCVDLWDEFRCNCVRPYIGHTCNVSVIPATFGYLESKSYALFSIPIAFQPELARTNVISLFFRTRSPNGLICYLGSELNNANSGQSTFIQVVLENGYVKVTLQIHPSDRPQLVIDQQRFDDGEQHFISVRRVKEDVSVTVDSHHKERIVSDAYGLVAKVMLLGGMVQGQASGSRKKRQAERDITDVFKGSIQDVRLNGRLLEFYPTNGTDGPPKLEMEEGSNIIEGEVDDDRCNQGVLLCEQNATCHSVFFNDYKCDCPEGYKGKNCSELNFCIYHQCASGSVCNDLVDGHECVVPATFNGFSTRLTYTKGFLSYQTSNTIKLAMRTRKDTGIIFQLSRPTTGQSVTLELNKQYGLLLRYNISEFLYVNTEQAIRDGSWHNVTVEVHPDRVSLAVDGQMVDKMFNRNPNQDNFENFMNGNPTINLGGPLDDASSQSEFYKGCMDEVRIDDVLLPYFYEGEGSISSTTKKFLLAEKTDLVTECVGDPVCSNNRCTNGATCVDIWNEYTCSCVLGFNGSYCETNIDDCVGHQCVNGASCVDGIANYTCDCAPGYEGSWCQTDIDECASDPCQNNATCFDQVDGYLCNCTANFTGLNCEVEVTEKCDNETNYPCVNGTCHTVNTSYAGVVTFECRCLPGYTGHLCESEIDYCEDGPCVNGSCQSKTDLTDYLCHCYPGYTGKNCSDEIDECDSSPCQNGGLCKDKIAGFECDCLRGLTGALCEADINECNLTVHNGSSPCERGVCINEEGSYRCDCSNTGYHGARCELEIDECQLKPKVCRNGGQCINTNGSYSCNCSIGYEDKNCTTPNCAGVCFYDGSACSITSENTWTCTCPQYHEGERCEVRGPCADLPCQNGGTCEQEPDGLGNYTCLCPPGWTGVNCTEDVDECESSPCLNNGNCTNTDGSYVCDCAPGFTGANCAENIDECISNPCDNGGSCTDGDNGYTCTCAPGYTGSNCETDIDECEEYPCNNNGTCENLVGTYRCHCPQSHLGDHCEFDNPCEFNPCLGQGNCTGSMFNSTSPAFKCDCFPEFKGLDCAEKVLTGEIIGGDSQMLQLIIGLIVGACLLIVIIGADHVGGRLDGSDVPYNLIIGLSVFGVLLILVIIAVIGFLIVARKKRATRGAYSPSRQEVSGSRVEMGSVLKPPPEERLI